MKLLVTTIQTQKGNKHKHSMTGLENYGPDMEYSHVTVDHLRATAMTVDEHGRSMGFCTASRGDEQLIQIQ